MHILITDDEAPARGELEYILGQLLPTAEIETAKNGLEAVEMVKSSRFDVLFLDINMPGLDGLTAAAEIIKLDPQKLPHIVFATAYNDHAVEAFELAALDYIVKPFDEKRLAKTVARIKKNLGDDGAVQGSQQAALESVLAQFVQEIGQTQREKPTITKLWGERENGNRLLVEFADILYIEAEGKRVEMVNKGGERLQVRQTLKELETRLGQHHFARVHKAYLVNLDHIAEVAPWFSGGYLIKIGPAGEFEIPLSRRYAAKLKELTDW